MKPLLYPTVNLNGSDGHELLKQHYDIQLAFEALNDALNRAMPHGRDYPPSPVDGERKDQLAREAFYERGMALHAIRQEFERVAHNIHEQIQLKERDKRRGRMWTVGNPDDPE